MRVDINYAKWPSSLIFCVQNKQYCMHLQGEFTTRTPLFTPGYHLLHCVNTSMAKTASQISLKFSQPRAPLSENYNANKINY